MHICDYAIPSESPAFCHLKCQPLGQSGCENPNSKVKMAWTCSNFIFIFIKRGKSGCSHVTLENYNASHLETFWGNDVWINACIYPLFLCMYEVTYLTPCCIDSRALEYVVGGGAVVDWHIEGHVGVEDSGRLGRDVAGAGEVLRRERH